MAKPKTNAQQTNIEGTETEPGHITRDPVISALSRIVKILDGLTPREKQRVMRFLGEHVQPDPLEGPMPTCPGAIPGG